MCVGGGGGNEVRGLLTKPCLIVLFSLDLFEKLREFHHMSILTHRQLKKKYSWMHDIQHWHSIGTVNLAPY